MAGVVLAVVLLIWIGSAVAGGSPAPAPTDAAAAPAPTTTSAPATTTPPTPGAAAATTTPAPAATTTTPAPEAALGPCPDASVVLTAEAAQPEYAVGEQPVFRLLVATSGDVPCTRTLDPGLQEVLVYSADGATRLWSSNDCFPGTGTDTKTLEPGQTVSYSIRWSGTTSSPGCTAPRTPVAAGTYTVVVGLAGLRSEPATFTIV